MTPIPPKSTSSRFRLRACTSNTKQRRRQRRSTFERRSRSNNVRLRPLQELFSSTLHGLEKVEKTADHLILLTPPLSLSVSSLTLFLSFPTQPCLRAKQHSSVGESHETCSQQQQQQRQKQQEQPPDVAEIKL